MIEHSPLPWKIELNLDKGGFEIRDFSEQRVVVIRPLVRSADNADFIVRACNSHYRLLIQLKAAFDLLTEIQDGSRTSIPESATEAMSVAIHAAAVAALTREDERSMWIGGLGLD